jgi:signal transduction histidine kinase
MRPAMEEPMPRLLIVDDNENIHHDFKKVLTNPDHSQLFNVESQLFGEPEPHMESEDLPIDYQIDDAYQGEEAIAMVEEAAAKGSPYAVIFMDVRMPPGIDGIKAASEIWRRHPDTEMVICSAHSDYSWTDMLKEIGISDKLQFIRKPFDMVTVQQLALSCSRKWELEQTTKKYIRQLELENREKEEVQAELANLNDELQMRINNRTREFEHAQRQLVESERKIDELEKRAAKAEGNTVLVEMVTGLSDQIDKPLEGAVNEASQLEMLLRGIQKLHLSGRMEQSDLTAFLETAKEIPRDLLAYLNTAREMVQNFKLIPYERPFEKAAAVPVRDWLDECLASNRDFLEEQGIALECRGAEGVVWEIYQRSLDRVLHQLMVNAATHGYQPGDTGKITVEAVTAGEQLRITVHDDGKGIPNGHLERIFEPFFTTSRQEGSAGLGLHVAYNVITRMMNGEIQCESWPGLGTTFTINLPRPRDA